MSQIENLYSIIKQLQKEVRLLSTVPQKIGSDSLPIVTAGAVSTTIGSVPAGGKGRLTSNLIVASELLSIWDFYYTIYVDNELNDNYAYPFGASLSAGQKNLRHSFSHDWLSSADAIGKRAAIVEIENLDVSAHTYYIVTNWYGLKQNI